MSMNPVLILGVFLAMTASAGAQYVSEPDAPTTPEERAARAASLKTKAADALKSGDYHLALQRIDRAIKLTDDPGLIANKGFILEKLGEFKKAAAAFRSYLKLMSEPGPKQDKARSFLARLEPEISFTTTPSGATVTLQGENSPRGTTPLKTNVVAGTHVFVVSLGGHKENRHLTRVVPGKSASIDLTLERNVPKRPPPRKKTMAESEVEVSSDGGGTTWAWVSLGSGALAAGAAGLFFGQGLTAADERDGATRSVDWDAHHATVEGKNTLYLTSGGVAITAILLGTYLLLTAPDTSPETLSLGPGTATFSVEF